MKNIKNIPYSHDLIDCVFMILEIIPHAENRGAVVYSDYQNICAAPQRIEVDDLDQFMRELEEYTPKNKQFKNQDKMEKESGPKKPNMEDLRDHLFTQLNRLDNKDISEEELEKEIKRAKAVRNIADAVIDTARVEVKFIEITGNKESSNFLVKNDRKRLEI